MHRLLLMCGPRRDAGLSVNVEYPERRFQFSRSSPGPIMGISTAVASSRTKSFR